MLKILSLGAGVQSTTVLLMSIRGELPRIDHAIFADTGWEPAAVYRHLEWLEGEATSASIPIHRVSAGNIRESMLNADLRDTRHHIDMPVFTPTPTGRGRVQRQCTTSFKIEPIHKKIREILGLRPRQRWPKTPTVEQWIGISLDEVSRMRVSEDAWRVNRYPLVFDTPMRRHDCLRWLEQQGYPTPPKSACIGCPFHSDASWRHLRDEVPNEWDEAVQFDAAIRHRGGMRGDLFLHPSLRPLSDVDLSTAEDRGQLNLFENECQGMCGV